MWLGGFHFAVAVVVGLFFLWVDSLDVAESEWRWGEACLQAAVIGMLWPLLVAFLLWNLYQGKRAMGVLAVGHKPIMTPAKELEYAILQAKRRWGKKGWAWHPRGAVKGDLCHAAVGVKDGGENEHQWTVYGIGVTFAEAFDDATERGN